MQSTEVVQDWSQRDMLSINADYNVGKRSVFQESKALRVSVKNDFVKSRWW